MCYRVCEYVCVCLSERVPFAASPQVFRGPSPFYSSADWLSRQEGSKKKGFSSAVCSHDFTGGGTPLPALNALTAGTDVRLAAWRVTVGAVVLPPKAHLTVEGENTGRLSAKDAASTHYTPLTTAGSDSSMHTSVVTSNSWLFDGQKFLPVQAMQNFLLALSKVLLTTLLWNITSTLMTAGCLRMTSWMSHHHHEGQQEFCVVKHNKHVWHQRCHCACIPLMYNSLIMDSPGVVLFSHQPRFCWAPCGGFLHGFIEEVIVCLRERSTTTTSPLNSAASSAVTWRPSLTCNNTKQNKKKPTIVYYITCLWVRLCLFLDQTGSVQTFTGLSCHHVVSKENTVSHKDSNHSAGSVASLS